jgi:hypothetical protein
MLFTKLFLDLDTDKGADEVDVIHDVLKLSEFCHQHDIPHAFMFSGWNGCHAYLFFKPQVVPVNQKLSTVVKSCHRWLRDSLQLKSANMACAEPKRLCRVPYTKYVGIGKGGMQFRPTYCMPIPPNWVNGELTLSFLRKVAEDPPIKSKYRVDGKYRTIRQFVEEFQIPVMKYEPTTVGIEVEPSTYSDLDKSEFAEIVRRLQPMMCIHNSNLSSTPPHFARFALAAQVRYLGFTLDEAIDFFDKLSNHAKWDDRQNKAYRDKQVRHILTHNPPYEVPRCGRIMQEKDKLGRSLCVGDICPLFERASRRWKNGQTVVSE